jgi:phosphoribosylformylglycinamidine synthase
VGIWEDETMSERVSHIQVMLKPGIPDVVGQRVQREARKVLGIETGTVKAGKIFSILLDLTPEQLTDFAEKGLRDQVTQDVFVDHFYTHPDFSTYLLVSRLPGVTDDEGVSAQRTLCDLFNMTFETATQRIFTSDIYLFDRTLSEPELDRLGHDLLANRLVQHLEYGTFRGTVDYVPEVRILFDDTNEAVNLDVSDEELLAISKSRVLSLNLGEMKAIRAYFLRPDILEQRTKMGLPPSPLDCELEVFAQTWSEHCKHKEFSSLIRYENVETGEVTTVDSLFDTFIKGSTRRVSQNLDKAGSNWLVKVFSDNAGVVRIDDDRVFVFKVETHNSPSALDPYGGAITGILGNNRDPLGTGRGGGRLLFNTNVLCFGSPYHDKPLLTNQLHPARVFEGVRKGIEDGGNKSGIPTVNGAIVFDERYAGKPLVYCGTGSIMPSKHQGLDSWVKEIAPGDRILMAGGRVGKDGIHGATFSSVEIDKHSPKSAVQIGSPITQKLLADFLEEACATGIVKCTTDNGAGGLSSSVGELATISGGAEVHLEKVPLKYSGLRPWEIFVSESQERMTLVVTPDRIPAVMELARAREVEITDVGAFSDSGYLTVCYAGKVVAHLELETLHHGVPRKHMDARWEPPVCVEPVLADIDCGTTLLRLMESENICSRERVIRQYDHEVKGKTVIKPLMGPKGKAPQDAAVMRLDHHSWRGIAVSNGIAPKYGDIDAYEMSAGAFDEAVRQIVSVGGRIPDLARKDNPFWSVNDNFCLPDSEYDPKGNPDGKYKLAQLIRMCQALYDMSTFFTIPMTSGKDSMKNDFRADGVKISVPPTILYSMVAAIDDVRRTVTSNFKATDDLLYLLGETHDELGASELYRLLGHLGANVPKVRREQAMDLYRRMEKLHAAGLLQSSHDLSDGGLAVTLAECTFGTGLGADIALPDSGLADHVQLFSESHSRFLVSVAPEDRRAFEDLVGHRCTFLGKVTGQPTVLVRRGSRTVLSLPVDTLLERWTNGLEK